MACRNINQTIEQKNPKKGNDLKSPTQTVLESVVEQMIDFASTSDP